MNIADKNHIMDLIALKQEGAYWDFKRQWYSNNSDLLHDIICMANNLENRDGYIIIGVDEEKDFCICGVDHDGHNRKNTSNIVDFLRDKKFAGEIRPTVKVEIMICDNIEIDVLVIYSARHTPYYLTSEYQGVCANNIYTRIQDTNTPKNKSADVHHVEMLWKRRFGLDASVFDRFLILLDEAEQWEGSFGNYEPIYHKNFPEFRIEEIADTLQYESYPQGAYYLNPTMSFIDMRLLYFNAEIKKIKTLTLDGRSIHIPCPQSKVLSFDKCRDWSLFQCYYYDLTKLEGKLLKMMTSGTLEYHSRHFNKDIHLFLIFNNEEDQISFEDFAIKHQNEINIDSLEKSDKLALAIKQANEYNGDKERVVQIAFISELYSLWRKTN
jgi:hypothetical protein